MKILKVRKKPIVVEALQWDGKNIEEVKSFLGDKFVESNIVLTSYPPIPVFLIKTLEGDMKVELGAYIIRGVEGEMWAVKESIFEKTYEIVNEIGTADEELRKLFEKSQLWKDNK